MNEHKQFLKDCNLRVTKFRLSLLSVFENHNAAISNEDIEHSLASFDRITLYRTLKSFEEHGVIHKINFGSEQKWALCPAHCASDNGHHKHEHIHFRCVKCEEILCVPTKIQKITIPEFVVDNTEINASGTCSKCLQAS